MHGAKFEMNTSMCAFAITASCQGETEEHVMEGLWTFFSFLLTQSAFCYSVHMPSSDDFIQRTQQCYNMAWCEMPHSVQRCRNA
jgi:hypothetical protein